MIFHEEFLQISIFLITLLFLLLIVDLIFFSYNFTNILYCILVKIPRFWNETTSAMQFWEVEAPDLKGCSLKPSNDFVWETSFIWSGRFNPQKLNHSILLPNAILRGWRAPSLEISRWSHRIIWGLSLNTLRGGASTPQNWIVNKGWAILH